MKLWRRAALVAAALTIGAAGMAAPAQAAAPPSAPVAPALTAPRPQQAVPKTPGGDLVVFADGASDAVAKAAAAVGARVVTTRGDRTELTLPAAKLATLAGRPGVTGLRQPDRAVPMEIDSQGLQASGAKAWLATAGAKKGDGVKIGVIDPGFDQLADSQAGGALPTGAALTAQKSTCADGGETTPHGTSIAEVEHAMAPNAQLYLACAGTSMEFGPAADWLRQQGVDVIVAALGFFGSGRGDGTGVAGSPADVVRQSSQAGIFWSVAAGNTATTHYAGPARTTGDGFVTFNGSGTEGTGFSVAGGAKATIGVRWDDWPSTKQQLDLYISTEPSPPKSPSDPGVVAFASNNQKSAGGEPTVEATVSAPGDNAVHGYYAYLKNVSTLQTTRFDLFASGIVGGLQGYVPAGSITEPGTSPWVVTAGAVDAVSGGFESQYSAQGPTIDGRMKPDLVGQDNVSTQTTYDEGGFSGTSVAAAHVGAAAALLKSQYPALDSVRLRDELLKRIPAVSAHSDNQWGHGPLWVGSPTAAAGATGQGYGALDPTDRQDAGYQAPGSVTGTKIAKIPADATAVEVTVTARSAPEKNHDVDVPSSVDVLPAGSAAAGTKATTLTVPVGQTFTSVTQVVTLGPDQSVQLRVGGGWVFALLDVRGYFSPSSAAGYTPLATPARVLDTRVPNPVRQTPVHGGDTVTLPMRGANGVPSGATAVAVDVTTVESTDEIAIDAYGQNAAGTTLVTAQRGQRRSNTAIVPIGNDGAIHLKNQSAGTTQLVVDLTGWFAGGQGARYVPLPVPERIADTTTGTGGRKGPLAAGEVAGIPVTGVAGIPADVTGAVLTTTLKDDNVDTELSAFPEEVRWTPSTALAARQGEPAATTVLTGLGASGRLDLRSERARADVTVDAWGYFAGGAKVTAPANDCTEPTAEAGYTAAFDGRAESGLEGWQSTGTAATASGCVLRTGTGNTDLTWYARHHLGNDYTLKLDWRADTANAVSNVVLGFANPGANANPPGAMSVRIAPGGTGVTATGAVNGQAPGAAVADQVGKWNTFEIKVSWNRVDVSLNGTRLNGYVSPDPSALAAATYLGVANSGTGDPVEFRDVRIRRDEPVASGAVTSIGGACLDLRNYDISELTLWTYTCNGTEAQNFSRPGDGTLQVAGRCVDAGSGTDVGAPVGLAACSGSTAQQWVARDDSLIGAASGRCLAAANASPQASLTLQDCASGSSSTQGWRLPAQHGVAGAIIAAGGRCVDLPNNDPTQDSVFLHDCNGTPAQQWLAIGDGTLRVAGKCLASGGDAQTGAVPAGTGVPQLECTGGITQQWVSGAAGSLVNPVSGLCLTALGDGNGAGITVDTCDGQPHQRWRQSVQNLVRGSIVGIGGKCVDVAGNTPDSSGVWLWTCYGPPGQAWSIGGDGLFRAFGKCLDVAGTAESSATTLMPCDAGRTTQRWVPQPSGYLVNVGSQLVLDDDGLSTADGNKLTIHGGNGGVNQKWSTPLEAALAGA